jgi:RHS repeat-associated protein
MDRPGPPCAWRSGTVRSGRIQALLSGSRHIRRRSANASDPSPVDGPAGLPTACADGRRCPDGTWVEYGYDGLERMVSRTDNTGATVLFFHDGLNEQIALETDAAGAVTTRYLVDSFGVARGKLDIGNSTGRSYYITDPRANVTQMIGASDQAVKAVFAYDPYGKDKTALSKKLTANWDSRLKFQMAPKDPKTGSYSLGSRLMDPKINRFVGSDNYVASGANLGLQVDPLTGNRYLYAGANPAGMIDDGHGPRRCNARTCWNLPDPKYNECKPNADSNFRKTKQGRKLLREGRFCHSSGRYVGGYGPDADRETRRLILKPVPKAAAAAEAAALNALVGCKEPRSCAAAATAANANSVVGFGADVAVALNECFPSAGERCDGAKRDVAVGPGADLVQDQLARVPTIGKALRAGVATGLAIYELMKDGQ